MILRWIAFLKFLRKIMITTKAELAQMHAIIFMKFPQNLVSYTS